MTGRSSSNEAGYSLIEVLVTVVIVGIAFVVFVGGMGVAIIGSDRHRKVAVTQASIRSFAEAVKAASYVDCAPLSTYEASYSPTSPNRLTVGSGGTNAVAHIAPSLEPDGSSQLLVFYALAAASSFSQPTGMAERWDRTATGLTVAFDDQALAGAAASGTRQSDSPLAGDWVAQVVSISGPAGAVAPRPDFPTFTTSANSITLPKPSGTTAGDAMFAQVAVRAANATVTAPSGWVLVASQTIGTSLKSLIYERTAASVNANWYVWSFSSNTAAAGGIVSYPGVGGSYARKVDSIEYGDGTSWASTCTAGDDGGLQRIGLSVKSADGKIVDSIVIVKRRP